MNLDLTRVLVEKGHEPVILDGKRPIFSNWPDRLHDLTETLWWARKGKNIGIKLRGLVVVDKDGRSGPLWNWMQHHRIHRSPMEVQTRKGVHVYFRLAESADEVRTRIRHLGLPVDILTGEDRQAVAPGSVLDDGFTYELRKGRAIVTPGELPVFPTDILTTQKEVKTQFHNILTLPDDRATRYVDKIEPAVSGAGGSRQTIVACLKILSLVDGDPDRAWALLVRYNARCVPEWDTEAEEGPNSLRRKLREARKYWKPR